MYLIMGTVLGRTETLDTSGSRQVAEHLAREYRLTFGHGCTIQVVKGCDPDDSDDSLPAILRDSVLDPRD